jgi:hypothetical protein
MAFCALSVLSVLALNGVQKERTERAQIEAIQSRERQVKELQKRAEEAFSKLTPSQHLVACRSEFVTTNPTGWI